MKYLSTVAVSILILIATLMPGSKIPDVDIVGIDKVAHFTLFFIWSLAVRYDYKPKFNWIFGWITGLIFSTATEVFQIFADGRSFDRWDILFDGLGLSVGLMVGKFILGFLDRILPLK